MGKTKNPFKALADMYKKQVIKHDKEGCAENFKKCTELFFRDISNEYAMKDSTITFENIEYGDGYFIFGFGTNSVIHFKIKECPGWKFGIWWKMPEKRSNKKYIGGTFFAQFEETIDKFKPTASSIRADIRTAVENNKMLGIDAQCDCWEAFEQINFIRKEPYLAFCRDYFGWDYNIEYHTRTEAKKAFTDYKKEQKNNIKYTKILNDKVLSFVREKISPLFENAEIKDRGESWYPRYQLVAPISGNEILISNCGPGDYDWLDYEDEEDIKLSEEYNNLLEDCNSIASAHEIYWTPPIHESIYLYEGDKQ